MAHNSHHKTTAFNLKLLQKLSPLGLQTYQWIPRSLRTKINQQKKCWWIFEAPHYLRKLISNEVHRASHHRLRPSVAGLRWRLDESLTTHRLRRYVSLVVSFPSGENVNSYRVLLSSPFPLHFLGAYVGGSQLRPVPVNSIPGQVLSLTRVGVYRGRVSGNGRWHISGRTLKSGCQRVERVGNLISILPVTYSVFFLGQWLIIDYTNLWISALSLCGRSQSLILLMCLTLIGNEHDDYKL